MFIKNPNQTFFTVSNQEEYLRNTMYIMCMTCLYYFRKEYWLKLIDRVASIFFPLVLIFP